MNNFCNQCDILFPQGADICPVCGAEATEATRAPRQPNQNKKPKPKGFSRRPGTALSSLMPSWAMSQRKGCGCKDYAAKMDAWGPEGCLEMRELIVEHIVGQKKFLKEPLPKAPDAVCRTVASMLVDKAIKMSLEDAEC